MKIKLLIVYHLLMVFIPPIIGVPYSGTVAMHAGNIYSGVNSLCRFTLLYYYK